MFDNIAPVYDRLNHLLSFNLDRGWRNKVVRAASSHSPSAILDMATGTGDLAIKLARRIPGSSLTGVDLSSRMIDIAVEKVRAAGLSERISLMVGDGEAVLLPDGGFDCATIAFGIRNYQDPRAGLCEFIRLLRPGGRIFVLEFSMPGGKIFGPLYRFYFRRVLPLIGGIVSGDRKAYEYLPGSVGEFPGRDAFLEMMAGAGFTVCRARPLMRGVAHIYSAVKPGANN